MEVAPVTVIQYFDGQKQNLIPLFQRPYQWATKNWSAFWDDLIIQYTNDQPNHFMGTIVSIPATSVPVGVNKFLIIDGQQRLTTISILLCVLRDFFETEKSENNAGKIHNLYLTNQYQGINDTLKFVPTQTSNDRETYKNLVLNKKIPDESKQHLMAKCYEFFSNKIKNTTDDEVKIDPEKLLLTLEKKFQVVMINLGKDDDPYLIFESLNYKGASLTQADLVRNHILMKFNHSISPGGEQERAYKNYWMPLNDDLIDENGNDYLTDFLRHYAMRNGENITTKNVYDAIKKEINNRAHEGMENILIDIKNFSEYYKEIINPKKINPAIAKKIRNIKKLDTTVPYPLLLKLISLSKKGNLSDDALLQCITSIESFIVRRSICRIPSHSLGKILLSIAKDINPEKDISIFVHSKLSSGTGNNRFPDDQEFRSALITDNMLYFSKIHKYLLEQLEISYNHKEITNVEETTVEHIMPQTASVEWIRDLGDDYDIAYKSFLHTIGNLTLTGYNSTMGNKPFSGENGKKETLKNSHISLNKFIAKQEKWGIAEIKERAEYLAAIAVKIWLPPTKKITT